MARPNNETEEDESFETRTPGSRDTIGRVDMDFSSPSPTASFSSDKENRVAAASSRQKEKSASMAPPQRPTPESSSRPHKRRKLGERGLPTASQAAHRKHLAEAGNTQFYDPDQPLGERRDLRKGYRELNRDFSDNRAEFLAPGSDGIKRTIEKQNELYEKVKQTSDATLDSRLLVSAADLSAKRTTQLNVGDSTTGIDVDDFVNRCKTFMRKGPTDAEGNSTQRRRRRDDDSDEEATEGFDEGDAYDWEWLGRQACCPNNLRPPVPGFLLGPLSVQKRARRQTQRRERLQRRNPNDAVRPEELKTQDLEKAENSNLTTLCRRIREVLIKHMSEKRVLVEAEQTGEESEAEGNALLRKHNLADDGGLPFFNFVVNPKSFGQTVENLFYVSFLIRDGLVEFLYDRNGLPTLHPKDTKTSDEREKEREQMPMQAEPPKQKHQAVFHLDFETWENIVEAFDIKESVIPNRKPDPSAQISATGWYA